MINNRPSCISDAVFFGLLEQRIHPTYHKKATSQRCARASAMTSEIDCTTRTKQKSTLSVDTLYRTRVRMLGPTLVPSVNSIVRTVIVTRKLQSLAATAAACEVHWETQYGPLAHVRGDSSWPCFRNIGSTREYLGSNNSQSALGQYSVHLSAPFLVTVGAIWAVSRDCSDCGTKANSPNNGDS